MLVGGTAIEKESAIRCYAEMIPITSARIIVSERTGCDPPRGRIASMALPGFRTEFSPGREFPRQHLHRNQRTGVHETGGSFGSVS